MDGERSRTMKKTIFLLLVLLSVVVLLVKFSAQAEQLFFGKSLKSGISIFSIPTEVSVFLNGQEAGKTPFEDKNLEVKQYHIKLEKNGASWQGNVKLSAGTVTVINRDLAFSQASAAGEILTLDKGRGLTVISTPSSADVEIDGVNVGKTPVSVNSTAGEHTVLVSRPNYLNRSIKAILPEKFNLIISVDLALSEADLTTISAPVVTQTPEVVVKQTPTGFLRVRDKASLNGKEIAQVKPGDKLVLLEELAGWDKIKLADGTEGFVSSTYVEKVEKQNPQ